jgi:hypothetical protein
MAPTVDRLATFALPLFAKTRRAGRERRAHAGFRVDERDETRVGKLGVDGRRDTAGEDVMSPGENTERFFVSCSAKVGDHDDKRA